MELAGCASAAAAASASSRQIVAASCSSFAFISLCFSNFIYFRFFLSTFLLVSFVCSRPEIFIDLNYFSFLYFTLHLPLLINKCTHTHAHTLAHSHTLAHIQSHSQTHARTHMQAYERRACFIFGFLFGFDIHTWKAEAARESRSGKGRRVKAPSEQPFACKVRCVLSACCGRQAAAA